MIPFVQSIQQVDKSRFKIIWTDGKEGVFHLAELQRLCPCSSCEKQKGIVEQEMSAKKIVSVGNYALRIDFTAGCSKGIYTYAFLRKLGDKS